MAVGQHGRGDVLVAHGRKGMLGRTIDGDDDGGKQRRKKEIRVVLRGASSRLSRGRVAVEEGRDGQLAERGQHQG